MRANRVGCVANVDCVDVFAVRSRFDEQLVVEIVIEATDKDMYVSHNLEDVQALKDGKGRL